jgi:sugar phosphate isomerase/epimerase
MIAPMIRSAVTVSLVEEARGGPFVYWDDLSAACRSASALGFDAIELFAPSPNAVDAAELAKLLSDHGLKLAAVGTGAGMVIDKLSLTDADRSRREIAVEFIRAMIAFGAEHGAPAIIGSMQGRWGSQYDKAEALELLGEALCRLGEDAARNGVPLIYEPLNRYETNLVNTVTEGVALLESSRAEGVKLLADLFHMNIEEADLPAALRAGGRHIGHVHFVDSNRRPAGAGHTDFAPIAAALADIGYDGYASAEAFPHPDSESAAKQTIETFRRVFRMS